MKGTWSWPSVAFRQIPESQWDRSGAAYFSRNEFFRGRERGNVSPPDEIDKPLMISHDYVRKDYGDCENRHTIAPVPPMGLEVMSYIPGKDYEYELDEVHRLEMQLPASFKPHPLFGSRRREGYRAQSIAPTGPNSPY